MSTEINTSKTNTKDLQASAIQPMGPVKHPCRQCGNRWAYLDQQVARTILSQGVISRPRPDKLICGMCSRDLS